MTRASIYMEMAISENNKKCKEKSWQELQDTLHQEEAILHARDLHPDVVENKQIFPTRLLDSEYSLIIQTKYKCLLAFQESDALIYLLKLFCGNS